MKIAAIIPVHNRRKTTLNYLRQMHRAEIDDIRPDIIIVDDGSTDGTAEAIQKLYPNVIILRGDGNLWWTGAVNVGVQYALDKNYDSVLLMNDDLYLGELCLKYLVEIAAKNPDSLVSSVVVCKTENGGEEIIAAGFRTFGYFGEIKELYAGEVCADIPAETISCDLLTGASLLVPVSIFRKIGIFDSKNFRHNYGDFEFTQRASLKGYACLVAVRSKVYTEHNLNYPACYICFSSRREYLKNLFNYPKYFYGFNGIRVNSYMHRSFVKGTMLYGYRLIGLFRRIFLKILLTKKSFQKYTLMRARKAGSSSHLVRILEEIV